MLRVVPTHEYISFYPLRVQAGFPSPADDHLEDRIDLTAYLIKRPSSTFVMQVTGDSMKGASIQDRDYIVVDKSITPKNGQIVVAILDGEMTVKYFHKDRDGYFLKAANPSYSPIALNEDNPPEIFGVVIGVFRSYA